MVEIQELDSLITNNDIDQQPTVQWLSPLSDVPRVDCSVSFNLKKPLECSSELHSSLDMKCNMM